MKNRVRGNMHIRHLVVFFLVISMLIYFTPGISNAYQSMNYTDLFNYPINSDGSPVWITFGGTWTVQADGGAVYCANTTQQAYAITGDSTWTDYTYSIKVKSYNSMGNGMGFRINDNNNLYVFQIDSSSTVSLAKVVNGTRTVMDTEAYSTNILQWYNLSVSVTGSQIKAFIDGQLLFNITDSTFANGKIGLSSQSNASFDDMKLTGIPGLFDDFSNISGYWNDINYITPTNLTNTFVFTGLSGWYMKADDIITYVDDNNITHQGIFDKVLAQPNYQNLIANGWTISVVRPDEFIYQYLN